MGVGGRAANERGGGDQRERCGSEGQAIFLEALCPRLYPSQLARGRVARITFSMQISNRGHGRDVSVSTFEV